MSDTNPTPRYIVMTSSARVPSTNPGNYRNVAVVETDGMTTPKMISERARGVVRIVAHWGKCNVGKTERGAYQRALAEAADLVRKLEARERHEREAPAHVFLAGAEG